MFCHSLNVIFLGGNPRTTSKPPFAYALQARCKNNIEEILSGIFGNTIFDACAVHSVRINFCIRRGASVASVIRGSNWPFLDFPFSPTPSPFLSLFPLGQKLEDVQRITVQYVIRRNAGTLSVPKCSTVFQEILHHSFFSLMAGCSWALPTYAGIFLSCVRG